METIKYISLKNRSNYRHDKILNLKDFMPYGLRITKLTYESINNYYINYCWVNNDKNCSSPLYLIIDEVDGIIREENGIKYLSIASTSNNKDILMKYREVWDAINNTIQIRNDDKPPECGKHYMTIKFDTYENDLPMDKIIKLHMLVIVIRSIYEREGKCCARLFINNCFYENTA